MRTFLKFITKLKGFWKFYKNYEYDGETSEFIITNYQNILQSRTKTLSEPTYYVMDVLEQIDNWYEYNPKGIKALETIKEIEDFLEVEICQTEERLKEQCYMFDGVKVSPEQAKELNESHIRFCEGILKIIEKSEGWVNV